MGERLRDNPAVRSAWNYSLFDAILNRRSRRMALGAEIPGGPHKYRSEKPPFPLDELEQALLVQAGTGVSGLNLSDLPFCDDQGRSASGNTMMQFTGRTWASPCGSHGTELFYWDDSGTWLVRLKDVCGEHIREYEGENIVLRYAIRTESPYSKPYAEFIAGWLKEIGIDTTFSSYDDGQLLEVAGKGDFDLYVWGWTPFVDPDPMLSYFKCDQISVDASDFSNYYNDTGLCDPEYDKLYPQQNTELDADARQAIVHDMLKRFYASASYIVTATSADLQAYRTDRFEGWVRQPAEIGPVLFSNSSPSYWNLTPIASAGDGGGLSTGGIVAIVVAGLVGLALVVLFVARRRTVEERE